MRPKVLKNKPLIEAIIEAKWNPSLSAPSGIDTNLRLFLGRFHDTIGKEYPALEVLPHAALPDNMAPNFAQYRFRKAEGGWPLVQLGPGLLTLNDAATYSWDDFRNRATDVAYLLFEAYPTNIELKSLELRYINATYIDFEKENVLRYMAENFRVQVSLPKDLFDSKGVRTSPNQFTIQTAFQTDSPAGSIRLSMARGRANDRDALLWETVFQSVDKQLPKMPEKFLDWLEPAHTLIEDWFFKLIDGALLKQYS